jgi:hypothetical protein
MANRAPSIGLAILVCCTATLRICQRMQHKTEPIDLSSFHPDLDPTGVGSMSPRPLGPQPDFGAFGFDPVAAQSALDGVWVFRDAGGDVIRSVSHGKLTTIHGDDTDVESVTVTSPCSVEAIGADEAGTVPIARFADGMRFASAGGFRAGDKTIACIEDRVAIDGPGGCHAWHAIGGAEWQLSDYQCQFSRAPDGVQIDVGSDEMVLTVSGGALHADTPVTPVRVASLDEAKAMAARDLAAMRAALAAKSTVAAIAGASTLAAGVKVKLRAYVRRVDEDAHTITIADTHVATTDEKTLACASAPAKIRIGDKVAITAELVADGRRVRLDKCAATHAR